MTYNIYTVKDVLTGNFSNIEIMQNDDVALRWFDGLIKESKIAKDLQLFKLGTYNIETGVIDNKVEFMRGGLDV